MSFIFLPSSIRKTLYTLYSNTQQQQKHKDRLNSGLMIQNAADDPVLYARINRLSNRATTLTERKQDIDQAVVSLDATLEGIDSMKSFILNIKSHLETMKDIADSDTFEESLEGLHTLLDQYDSLAKDSSYEGLNLVTSDRAALEVRFTDEGSRISIVGAMLLARRPYDEAVTALYNPFDDYTLIEAFKNLTSMRRQFSGIEGYTRLLGFGFSLLDDSISRRGYLEQINRIIRLVGFTRGNHPGLPLNKASWALALMAATALGSSGIRHVLQQSTQLAHIFSVFNIRVSRKSDNNRFLQLLNVFTVRPYLMDPSLLAFLKFMTSITQFSTELLLHNPAFAQLLSYMNVHSRNDSLFNMRRILPLMNARPWVLDAEHYVALQALASGIRAERTHGSLYNLSLLSLALMSNRFPDIVKLMSQLGITYGNASFLEKILALATFRRTYLSIKGDDLRILRHLFATAALSEVFSLTAGHFLNTDNNSLLEPLLAFLQKISYLHVSNRGPDGARDLLAYFKTIERPVTLYSQRRNFFTQTVQSTTNLAVAVERIENLNFERLYQSGELAFEINASIRLVESAMAALDKTLRGFSDSVSILSTRQDFTDSMISSLKEGYGQIALINEEQETSILQTLLTSEKMGFRQLSITNEQQQQILDLLR